MQGFQLLDKRYEVLVFMNKQTYTHISNNIKTWGEIFMKNKG